MAIITISRGSYSGGRTLATCVAQRLGYPCLGREGVYQAAFEYGIPVDALTKALEEPPSFWKRLTGYRDRYLNFVRAALLDHVQDGKLVYHGHAGHLLLPNLPQVLRVRVVADIDLRVAAVQRQQPHLSRKEAIAYIERMDRQRVLWARFLYDVDWTDPNLYDVVLNVNRMGISGACDALVNMIQSDAFKSTHQSKAALEDLALSSRVWAALAGNKVTEAAELETRAEDGTVTITGVTHFREVFDAIPTVASQIRGVKEVRSLVRETSHSYP